MSTEEGPPSIRRELVTFALIAFVMAPVLWVGLSSPLGWPGINILILVIGMLILCVIGVAAVSYENRRASAFEESDGVMLFRYSRVTRSARLYQFSAVFLSLLAFQAIHGTPESAPYSLGFAAILAIAAFLTKREARRLRDIRVTPRALEVSREDGTWERVPWARVNEIVIAAPSQLGGHGIEIVSEKSRVSVFRSIRGFRVLIAELRKQVATLEIPVRGVDWDNIGVFVEADRNRTAPP